MLAYQRDTCQKRGTKTAAVSFSDNGNVADTIMIQETHQDS